MKEFRIWTGASMAGLLFDPVFFKCLLSVILLLCSRTCFVESQSCITLTTQEAIDVKTYRSPIVVEGAIVTKYDASVRIKVKRDCKKLSNNALKGERITISGFGQLNPCVEELSTFNSGTNYMFYINVTEVSNEFQLTGNPDTADKKVRNIVKSTAKNGGPPRITSGVRSKRLAENEEFLAKCAVMGNPLPDITWRKDNETVTHNSIGGLRIRTKKKKKASSQLRIKRVKKLLHEGTYTCVANNHVDGPVLSSAILEICALQCENGGELNVKRCRCKCQEGWEGETCDTRKCTKLDCGTGGSFDRENCQCQCNDGFIFENETCVAASTTAIADASCNNGLPCQNGGTCVEEEDPDGTLSHQCRCRPDLTGPRCETALCTKTCLHGTLDEVNCECHCLANYTGPSCEVLADNHVNQCPKEYESYCLNGGTCRFIFELQQPSCFCTARFQGTRCEFIRSEATGSIGASSKKIVICLSIIFITLLIIVVLLLLAYIKNKNAREREIQERMEHAGRMGVPRPNTFSLATVPATSIELQQYRRPSAPQPQRYQIDGDLVQPNFHSHSVDGRIGNYGSGSLKQNSQTPNGYTGRVSQASLQSVRSNGSLRSVDRAPSASQKVPVKQGYEAVPLDNPDELETPRIEVVDEETPLRTATMDEEPRVATDRRGGRRSEQEPLSTETESELESNNGDVAGDRVDDLNPQLEALQSHPALKEEQETEDSVGDCSSDLGYTVNPYVMESPVRKAPHRTRNRLQGSNGQPRHMGIYSNPMEGGAYARPVVPTSQAIDIQDGSGYYAQRLRDVVENSPPSAV